MLSRELDEAILILRDKSNSLDNRIADLLLVCAAQGDIIQAVAEGVAKEVIALHKQDAGKIELRNDEIIPWPAKDKTNSRRNRLWG